MAAGSIRSAIFDADGGSSELSAVRGFESSFEKEVTIAERGSKWPCHATSFMNVKLIRNFMRQAEGLTMVGSVVP